MAEGWPVCGSSNICETGIWPVRAVVMLSQAPENRVERMTPAAAFSQVYGKSAVLWLTAAMTMFALATVLGWGLYGARCGEFLFGSGFWPYFAALQIIAVFAGSFLDTGFLWQLSEAVNGLMAIPNLITLALLAPEAARLTKEYKESGNAAGGGTYADFH